MDREPLHRRLIRPSLSEIKEQAPPPQVRRKPVPPELTNAEAYYYVKQMQARTPVVVVLNDGEQIRGVVEWYDRQCIKITRANAPNLLVYKTAIKYIYKDENGARDRAPAERELEHASTGPEDH